MYNVGRFPSRYALWITIQKPCVGHREIDWLKAFNDGFDLTMSKISKVLGKKPKCAFLMRDGEGAITKAWEKSKWPKTLASGQCTTHGKWNAQQQKMSNGQPFGPERGKVWYGLIFKTCHQSFMDAAAETIALWESKGDHVGAQHLSTLVKTSTAPLFRWAPVATPGISAQGSETVNQLMKKSPKDGTRRQKQTFLQFARAVIDVGYRSYRILVDSPKIDKGLRATQMKKLDKNGKSMSKGKYAVMLASLQQLNYRAFKIVAKLVEEGPCVW